MTAVVPQPSADALRATRVVNAMTVDEARNAGISEEERLFYLRVNRGKANYLPPAVKASWFKFENVTLLNGDNVGVLGPWQYPGQGSPAAEITETQRKADHVFIALLTRFTLENRQVSHKAGSNYAPHLFAEESEARIAKVGKAVLAEYAPAAERAAHPGLRRRNRPQAAPHPRRDLRGRTERTGPEVEGRRRNYQNAGPDQPTRARKERRGLLRRQVDSQAPRDTQLLQLCRETAHFSNTGNAGRARGERGGNVRPGYTIIGVPPAPFPPTTNAGTALGRSGPRLRRGTASRLLWRAFPQRLGGGWRPSLKASHLRPHGANAGAKVSEQTRFGGLGF